MTSRDGLYQFNYNKAERKKLAEILGTEVKAEQIKKIKERNLTPIDSIAYEDKVKEYKLRKLKAETKILEYKANYIETFNTLPSNEASNAIKQGVYKQESFEPTRYPVEQRPLPQKQEPISPYDEKNNRAQCPECGIIFSQGDIYKQFTDLKTHLRYTEKNGHKRELRDFELEIFQQLFDEHEKKTIQEPKPTIKHSCQVTKKDHEFDYSLKNKPCPYCKVIMI